MYVLRPCACGKSA